MKYILLLLISLITVCPQFAFAADPVPDWDEECGEGSYIVRRSVKGIAECTIPFKGFLTKEGKKISPKLEAEINRRLARKSIEEYTIAYNHEAMKRGSAYPTFAANAGETKIENGCRYGEATEGYCQKFATTREAAVDHFFASLYLYQIVQEYGMYLAIKPAENVCKDLGFKNGNVWKEDAESGPGGVVVLQAKYCDGSVNLTGSLITNFRIEDALGAQVVKTQYRYCNTGNQGRYHHNFLKKGRELGVGPLFVRYTFQGKEECRKVPDPSKSYR